MSRDNLPLPQGVSLLAEHLRRRGLTIAEFCRRGSGDRPLDRVHVSKILAGKRRRICVDTAVALERMSEGEVPVPSWCLHGHGAALVVPGRRSTEASR
jgi:hypothetical protein